MQNIVKQCSIIAIKPIASAIGACQYRQNDKNKKLINYEKLFLSFKKIAASIIFIISYLYYFFFFFKN
jgi:hypothetical protein